MLMKLINQVFIIVWEQLSIMFNNSATHAWHTYILHLSFNQRPGFYCLLDGNTVRFFFIIYLCSFDRAECELNNLQNGRFSVCR